MSATRYTTQRAVAVITLQNPPVNGLGHELRSGIVEGLDRAVADPAVKAVVLVGAGRAFSGGADIREFNTPKASAEPVLGTVIRAIEASPKPVVAAIHGVAMGGGLELALACHHRVALPGAQIALPEVKLGLLPGAGGTQRLPRLLGLELALSLIVSGESVWSGQLEASPLFDELIEGDLVSGAVAFAEKVVAERRPLRLVRDLKVAHPNAEGFLAFAKSAVAAASRGLPAPGRCLEAVAAAVSRPFDEGLRVEREAFLHLVQTSESKALRHAFFAERMAAKIPDVPEDAPTRPIGTAAVIGAGTMGGGIAMNFASAGIPVTVLELSAPALEKGLATIRKNYQGNLKKGRITAAQLEERMGLIRPTTSYADIGQADIVIEAVFEDLAVKEQVFRQLDQVMKPGAILATNTSTLDVNRIAGFTKRPQDVIGTHFFSPANVMKLLEVVRGSATAVEVLATVMALAKKLKKVAVVSGVCDGFIGNRMLEQYIRQAMFLLEEGAMPQQVDGALEKWGMAMGPFRMGDLAGNDVGWYIRKRRYVEKPHVKYSRVADRLCELGRFGQKTGAGWYRYEAGQRDAIRDPVVEELITAHSAETGLARRTISDEEIVERCLFALVNEGARILEEGIALRASDLDVVYLSGYGFPASRGGPMHYADSVGLYNVARAMARFAANPQGDPGFWKPAPLLGTLAAEGKSFNEPRSSP
jgi:3-hydroxyacyl-CoA dehydrogenase